MGKPENENEQAPAKGGSKKGLIIILILLIVLGAVGFVVVKMFLMAPPEEAANAAGANTAMQDGVPGEGASAANGGGGMASGSSTASKEVGTMIELDPFVINLVSTNANTRYLKLEVVLEVPTDNSELSAEITAKTPEIRDVIISVVSSKTYEEIATAQGKLFLKQELIRKLNAVLSSGMIMNVFFTDFVAQ